MDVQKYVCEWHRTCFPGASNIALNHSDVNLNNVKVKAHGPITWKPLSDNASGAGASHEQVTVPGPGQAIGVVTITEEIKGLNKEITLGLAGTGHKDTLGDHIEIDPSKKHSQKSIPIKPVVANAQTSHKHYKAQFECTVSMKGVVLMGNGLQHELSEIFKDLKESQKPSDKDLLQHVKFEGKKVLLPLKGTVHFHWQA